MQVLVGVGVLIFRNGQILLGKRKGSHGAATWAPPGGHLDAGEAFEACAIRETAEETGLVIDQLRHADFTSNIFADENKHFVTLFVEAQQVEGDPEVLEPSKCEVWQWFDWDDLPQPLFAAFKSLLEQGFQPSVL